MKHVISVLLAVILLLMPLIGGAENVSDSLVIGIYSTKTLEIRVAARILCHNLCTIFVM